MSIQNPQLISLIRSLRRQARKMRAPIWRATADRLSKSRRGRVIVNLSKINRHTSPNETVLVPGKVLGAGILDHPVRVAAFQISRSAQEKIVKAGGSCLTIQELMKENPRGSGIKIIG